MAMQETMPAAGSIAASGAGPKAEGREAAGGGCLFHPVVDFICLGGGSLILFALLGGMVADVRDRRQVLIWTSVAATLFAATLAILTLTGRISVVAIYLLTAAGAAATAFVEPAHIGRSIPGFLIWY